MNSAAIIHRSTREYILPIARNTLFVRLSAAKGDIKECRIYYWKRSLPIADSLKMEKLRVVYRDEYHDDFRTEIEFREPVHYIKYYFELTDQTGEIYFFTDNGINQNKPSAGFFEFLYANEADVFQVPEWAKGIVYYQIFPDRFSRSINFLNNGNLVPWESIPDHANYFGGTLRGITEKLSYLKELGIDCIYLTPIFKAEFNHKYATIDYFSVDPAFGSLSDLQELVNKAHSDKIRVILDGVFNHVGCRFPQFADLAEKGENSGYKDWFFYSDLPLCKNPLNYECVGDYACMPKLKTFNPEVRNFILEVLTYWVETAGIDGWRLDVADEIEMSTLQTIRTELKYKYPDLLLLGETWGDAFRLVGSGDQMDNAMNYLFRNALLDWIAKRRIPVSEFDNQINRMLAKYNDSTNSVMYNLIGSHDTARFLFESSGDQSRLKLAAAFQMTFCGSPAIYYGDEVGMTGDNDPGCRAGMVWDYEKQDAEILEWYRRFIGLRKRYPVLCDGSFRSILCNDKKNLYGFMRKNKEGTVYILLNNSSEETVSVLPLIDGAGLYKSLLSSDFILAETLKAGSTFLNQEITEYDAQANIKIGPYSVEVLEKEKTK